MVCGVAIDPSHRRCGHLTVTHRLSLASCCCLASEVTTHSNTPLSTWFATLLPALAKKILTPKLFFLELYLGFWVWGKGGESSIKRCIRDLRLLFQQFKSFFPKALFAFMPSSTVLIHVGYYERAVLDCSNKVFVYCSWCLKFEVWNLRYLVSIWTVNFGKFLNRCYHEVVVIVLRLVICVDC